MPYIITEPQKVLGTKIGYSIYPYNFSFQDKIQKKEHYKFVIFKLKDSPFVEADRKLSEQTILKDDLSRNLIENILKSFLKDKPSLVEDKNKMEQYFFKEESLSR